MNKLVEFGFDPIAIDIPGRGESIGDSLSDIENDKSNILFWEHFIKKLELDRPILVSASTTHRFVMGWIDKHHNVSQIKWLRI